MKNTKLFVVLAGVGLAGTGLAQYSSPELLMVTDSGGTLGNGTVVPAQVERYDPYTGAYLGAFGAGYFEGTPDGITIIGQDAYVTDLFTQNGFNFSRIDKFNFSTGAYDGSVFNSGPFLLSSTSTYGGNLIVGDLGSGNGSGIIWTLSPTGNMLTEVSLPANLETRGATVVGNQLWVATQNSSSGTGAGMLVYNLNADGTISSSPTTVGGGTGYGGYTSVLTTTVNGTQYVYTGGYDPTASNGVIDRWDTNGTNGIEQEITSHRFGAYSMAAGHDGIIYSFDSGYETVRRYDGGNSFGLGSLGEFGLNNTAFGENIAVYAAPEPVTMIALGLGVAALAMRRRRVFRKPGNEGTRS